jgi:hypothetical protein
MDAMRDDVRDAFAVVHSLALRGTLPQLPHGADALVREGLIQRTLTGYELTPPGHSRHRALLETERRTLDLGLLSMAYARLPAVTRRLRALLLEWEANDEPARRRMVSQVCAIVDEVELILRRSAAVAPRFGSYGPRLAAARSRLLDGDQEHVLGPGIDSILTVWKEMSEDYLQTLGCGHSTEDL